MSYEGGDGILECVVLVGCWRCLVCVLVSISAPD